MLLLVVHQLLKTLVLQGRSKHLSSQIRNFGSYRLKSQAFEERGCCSKGSNHHRNAPAYDDSNQTIPKSTQLSQSNSVQY
jgi:hypothetical protein